MAESRLQPNAASVADKLRWLMDRAEIQDLLDSYSRGVDHGDLELTRQLYHDGAIDDHGIFSGDGDEFAGYVIPRTQRQFTAMQHHRTTTSMDIRGDDAEVESYWLSVCRNQDGALQLASGRFADHFARRNGRWGVVHRQLINDWTLLLEDPAPGPQDELFLKGRIDQEDAARSLLPRLVKGGFFGNRPRR